MRKLMLICLVIFAINVKAQEVLSHSEVVQVEGATASAIYKNVKKWFAKTYRSAQNVIQYDDVDAEVSGKGIIPYDEKSLTWAAASGLIYYDVIVKVKDGRFKITIENFNHRSTHPTYADKWSNGFLMKTPPTDDELTNIGVKGLAKKQYKAIDKRIRPICLNEIAVILSSIKESMNKQQNEDDNW